MTQLYPEPHNHLLYGRGHGERVQLTIQLASKVPTASVADLSAGNGHIAKALHPNPILGDYAPGYPIQGPIEETIHLIPHVSTFILSETLEHLDDPDSILQLIGKKADHLILTTPLDAFADTNPEHLWAWDREAVEAMLQAANFGVKEFQSLDSRTYGEPYLYGIWWTTRL